MATPGTVVVIGGMNVDTLARVTGTPTTLRTSNPGATRRVAGGVGRNIAENLARLGSPVRMVGSVGDDLDGRFLLDGLGSLGVDMSGVRRGTSATGTYTAVLDDSGDLVIGVADMAATESLRPEDIGPGVLTDAAWLVLDGNLLADTIGHCLALAAAADVPVALDPVGVAKAARLDGLGGVHTFTPNRDELAAWSRCLRAEDGVAVAHARGAEVVWLREGSAGSRLFRARHPVERMVLRPAPVTDVTGAGDAMLAAYVHAMVQQPDPTAAAWLGTAAAWLTVQAPTSVRPDLTEALVRATLKEFR